VNNNLERLLESLRRCPCPKLEYPSMMVGQPWRGGKESIIVPCCVLCVFLADPPNPPFIGNGRGQLGSRAATLWPSGLN